MGYPGDCDWQACYELDFGFSPYGEYMWADWYPSLWGVDEDFIFHAIDTWAGQSGAALFRESDYAIVGIHAMSYNFTTGDVVNLAVRLTSGRIEALDDFCGQYPGCSIPIAGQGQPAPTNTPAPSPTNTPEPPTPTSTPEPTPTNTPEPTPTNTPQPTVVAPTMTPTPVATATPLPDSDHTFRELVGGINLIGGPQDGSLAPGDFVSCLPDSSWRSLYIWDVSSQSWLRYLNTAGDVPDYVNAPEVGGIDRIPRGAGVFLAAEHDMTNAAFPNSSGSSCP